MNSLSIRLARPEEVARLGEIEGRACELFAGTDIFDDLNGEIYDPEELGELIRRKQVWIACFEDDIPVGFVVVLKIEDALHVDELDVLPEFGRRGIGAALLEHACEWGSANGFAVATLSTFRDIPWNAPFYTQHGFQTLGNAELTPWMLSLRETESSKGLSIEKRVIMRRSLS